MWRMAPCVPVLPTAQMVALAIGVALFFAHATLAFWLVPSLRLAYWWIRRHKKRLVYYRTLAYRFEVLRIIRRWRKEDGVRIQQLEATITRLEAEAKRSADTYHSLEIINDRANEHLQRCRARIHELELQLAIRTTRPEPG